MSTPDSSPQAAESPQNAAQVLPWHHEAAKEIQPEAWGDAEIANLRLCDRKTAEECRLSFIEGYAKTIARHDPHAAQHAATVRLLENVTNRLKFYFSCVPLDENEYRKTAEGAITFELFLAVEAHLATLQPATAEKGTQ